MADESLFFTFSAIDRVTPVFRRTLEGLRIIQQQREAARRARLAKRARIRRMHTEYHRKHR